MADPWAIWSQWIIARQDVIADLDTLEQDSIRIRARDLARQNIQDTATFWAHESRHYQNEITRRKAVFELLAAQRQLQLLDTPQAFLGLVHTMVQEGTLIYQPLTEGPVHPHPSQLPFALAPPPAPVPADGPAPDAVPGPDPVPEHVPEQEAAIEGNNDVEEEDPEEPIFIDLTGEPDDDSDGGSTTT